MTIDPPTTVHGDTARKDRVMPDSVARPVDALDALVFVVEMALLAALAVAGARLGSHIAPIALAVLLPLVTAALWGLYLAPRASRRLPHPWRLGAKLAVTLAAAALLAASGAAAWGLAVLILGGAPFTAGELRTSSAANRAASPGPRTRPTQQCRRDRFRVERRRNVAAMGEQTKPAAVAHRDAVVGVAVAGGFGIGWAFWAASGLSGAPAAAVRIAGALIGAVIVVGAIFRHGAADPDQDAPGGSSGSMFRSRGYLLWVAAELILLLAGNAALGATRHSGYVAAWTAFVVGVHFLGFGRLFAVTFYWLGAGFIAAAIIGAAAGAASDNKHAVEASTGLVAAASLFAAGVWRLLAPAPSDLPQTSR